MSYYLLAPILEVRSENESVSRFVLATDTLGASLPGQYVMAWLPRAGEIPLSLAGATGENVTLVIESVGSTSRTMNQLKATDRLFLRGPYGSSFHLEGDLKYLLVAGGVGAVPLFFAAQVLANRGAHTDYVGGGRSARFVLFKSELQALVDELHVTTDDGSEGSRCSASRKAKELIDSGRYDRVLTCGPEAMMYDIIRACAEDGIECEASVVRLVRCSHGVCGSCVIEPGLLVCRDGPVFSGRSLLKTEFGKQARDEFGNAVTAH